MTQPPLPSPVGRPSGRRRESGRLKPALQHACGFTLLEVLVALAILAVALGAAIKAASDNTRNSIYLRDRTLAHWVAMNQITEWQLRAEWPNTGKSDGSSVMANHEWFWETEIQDTPDQNVRAIIVRVRGERDAEEPLATLQGYIGRQR